MLMRRMMWKVHKGRGLGELTRAVLYKAKNQLPAYNPHHYLKHVTGLIHVGAHSGQERYLYAKHNLNVVWVEAQPSVFTELCDNIKSYPSQTAANYLITDCDDAEYVFHIANNRGESSSIFELHEHKNIWPEVHFERDVTLRSITLDSLLRKLGTRATNYQALVIDTQGSELLVLKGATELLSNLEFVRTEAADFESYLGGAKVDELIDYLNGHSFRLIRQDPFPQPVSGRGRQYDLLFQNTLTPRVA
jgi:FkbM family methyltransferase